MFKKASVCILLANFASGPAFGATSVPASALASVENSNQQQFALQAAGDHAVAPDRHEKHKHDEHKHVDSHEHEYEESTDGDNITGSGEAHVHGKALLTLVLEGNEMQLAFQSAAFSVVGFEHKPATAEQKQEVAAAIEVFNQGSWFAVNGEASCELSFAEASTDLTAVKATKGHADFYANYQLLCQRPARLAELTLSIFNLVPALENVDVQWIINGKQGAATASLTQSTVRF